MTSRAALVAAMALCTVLGACGRPGDDRAPDVGDDRTAPVEDAGTEPGVGSDPIGSDPSPSTGATSPTSAGGEPGQVDAATPADTDVLAGQFTAIVGGIGDGESCPDDAAPEPYVGRPPWVDQQAFAGETVLLCLGGFDPVQPIVLSVATPTGRHRVSVLPTLDGPPELGRTDLRSASEPVPSTDFGAEAWRGVQWWLAPGSPVGTWSLTATQGRVTTTASVEVRVGSIPRFTQVGAAGSTHEFHVSGFPTGRTAVGLYRPETPRLELDPDDEVAVTLVAELEPVEADDTGAGTLVLDLAGHEAGEWCVSTQATPGVCRWVTIE